MFFLPRPIVPSSLRRWSSRLVAGPAERRSQPRGSCSACLAAATQWAPAPSFSSAAPGRMFPSAPRGGAPNTAAPSGAAGATQHSRARALGARSTLSTWSLAYEHGTPRAAPSTSLRQIYRIARRRCNFGSCLVPVAQADRAEPQPRVPYPPPGSQGRRARAASACPAFQHQQGT